jgi:peptidoglycan/LPS O-acetylase OafA/YrhL
MDITASSSNERRISALTIIACVRAHKRELRSSFSGARPLFTVRRLGLMLASATRGTMTQKANKASNHWPLLDFLRATAALLVVCAHSRALYFLYMDVADQDGVFLKLFYFITDLGHQAVVIFFVLSGFLIGGSLTDSMQRGRFDLVRYLIARFVRIYVVYLPALVITQGIFLFGRHLLSNPGDGPLFVHQQLDFGGVAQAVCFVSGLQGFSCPAWEQNPALWSLGYEWALYLFAPAIILLIVWKASPGLRLMAIVLVCAIAVTVCHYPIEAVFWFSAWFLGAGSYRILHSRHVPLPAGLLGAGLIIAGMAIRHLKAAGELETDTIIAVGAAIAIACRQLVTFPLAPRLVGWAAGFSYTLYALHLPLVFLIVSIFQGIGFPRENVPPSPAAFMEFGVTVAFCLLIAFLVSLVTERKTGEIRGAMMRMCPPRADREASEKGLSLKQGKNFYNG